MITQHDVLAIWTRGATCYAPHNAKALYVVTGDKLIRAACGDHLSRAVREVSKLNDPPLVYVTVWIKP